MRERDKYIGVFDLAGGDYNITVVYDGDSNYNGFNSSANVTVSPVPAQGVNIAVNIPEYGDDAVVNVTVIGLDGKAVPSGNVTIFVNGTEVNKTLTDGKCSYIIPTILDAGNYEVTVRYNGDNNYTSIENSTILAVIPKSINMSAVIYNGTYGDGSISGVVNASMNGTVYVQVVTACTPLICNVNESGEFSVPVDLVAGDYPNAYVSFVSDDVCVRKTISGSCSIKNVSCISRAG